MRSESFFLAGSGALLLSCLLSACGGGAAGTGASSPPVQGGSTTSGSNTGTTGTTTGGTAASGMGAAIAAANKAAATDPLCSVDTLGDFYWEIGTANSGTPVASGAQGQGSVTASSNFNIASASKWIFGAYVLEKKGWTRFGMTLPCAMVCVLCPVIRGSMTMPVSAS